MDSNRTFSTYFEELQRLSGQLGEKLSYVEKELKNLHVLWK